MISILKDDEVSQFRVLGFFFAWLNTVRVTEYIPKLPEYTSFRAPRVLQFKAHQ